MYPLVCVTEAGRCPKATVVGVKKIEKLNKRG